MMGAQGSRPRRAEKTPPPPPAARSRRGLPLGAWIGIGAGAAIVLLGVLFYAMLTLAKNSRPVAASESDEPRPRNRRAVADVDFRSEREKAREELQAKQEAENPVPVVRREPQDPRQNLTPTAEPLPSKPEPLDRWNEDILAKNHYLPLPERAQTIGLVENRPVEIAKIPVVDPSTIDLRIHTAGSSRGFVIDREDQQSDHGKLRRWTAQRKIVDPFTKQERLEEVGMFELAAGSLSFAWNMEAPAWTKPLSLQFGLLEIAKGGKSEFCRLCVPNNAPDARLADEEHGDSGKATRIFLAVKSQAVHDPSGLLLDVELQGIGEQVPTKLGMKIGDTAIFPIMFPDSETKVELEISYQFDEKFGPALVLNTSAEGKFVDELKPAQINKGSLPQINASRRPVNSVVLKKLLKDAAAIKEKMEKSRIYTEANKVVSNQQNRLALLQAELNKNPSYTVQKQLEQSMMLVERQIVQAKAIVDGFQSHMKLAEQNIAWCGEMQTHIADLQKSARIRYAVYTEIQGQKMYLARSLKESQ